MPRYFFDLDDHEIQIDTDGTELADAAEARIQAIVYAGSLMRDEPGLLRDGRVLSICVRSETRRPVTTIHIRAEDPAD